ncbi:MAG TPA: hypothetical protein VKQ52_12870 [Puia sp.]|nr:hypothetical protein [Puia sp.]
MRKLLILCALFIFAFLFFRCRKDRSTVQPLSDTSLIQNARKYFNDSVQASTPVTESGPRITTTRQPLWDSAKTINTAIGKAVIVPIHYDKDLHIRANFAGRKLFNLDELTHLLIYCDPKQRHHAELITGIPDSIALFAGKGGFSGILFVEDWSGHRIKQYKYGPDGSILQTGSAPQTGKGASIINNSNTPVSPDIVYTTCYEIDGYNYSEGDPEDGYSWSESAGCVSMYFPIPASIAPIRSPSAGNYGYIAAPPGRTSVTIAPPDNPIDDIKAYFKCFTSSSGVDHSYTVTVCVSQPVPGTRLPWAFTSGGVTGSSTAGNAFDVGHTFLIFSENSAGNIVARNVGFYPEAIVNPLYPSDQGILDDNERTPYNISLSFTVTNTQFFNMLNYAVIGNNPGYFYDLNSNNCTTFVLHALAAGGISLASRQGTWPGGGHGYDPGDLGEDIRGMSVPSNAKRNTVQNPHPNQGNCN